MFGTFDSTVLAPALEPNITETLKTRQLAVRGLETAGKVDQLSDLSLMSEH